jgi:hypothetical protein
LLLFLYPSCPPGQTAKTILLVSGRAGIDFTIDIVAVNQSKGSDRGLGMESRKGLDAQQKPQNNSGYDQQFLCHFLILKKTLYPIRSFKTRGDSSKKLPILRRISRLAPVLPHPLPHPPLEGEGISS